MSSTINGYEGTGRSLSLKLLDQLRKQSNPTSTKAQSSGTPITFRTLREVSLEESIRYIFTCNIVRVSKMLLNSFFFLLGIAQMMQLRAGSTNSSALMFPALPPSSPAVRPKKTVIFITSTVTRCFATTEPLRPFSNESSHCLLRRTTKTLLTICRYKTTFKCWTNGPLEKSMAYNL